MNTTLLVALGLGGVFLSLLSAGAALAPALHDRRQVERSLAALRAASIGAAPASADGQPAVRRAPRLRGLLADLGRRLPPDASDGRLAHQLDRAGNPAGWDAERLAAAKVLVAVAVGVAGGFLGGRLGAPVAVLGAVAGAAAGLFLPSLVLLNLAQRRQALVQRALPDSMDMLTIAVEAGLSCDAGISQVARNTKGPLAAEFSRVLQEMQLGKSRAEAFRSLHARTELPELKSFVTAVVQAEEFGLPIAGVLRAQSSELRLRRRQRAEEKAQKVAVKMTVPMILCVFPALFAVTIGPGLLHALTSLQH